MKTTTQAFMQDLDELKHVFLVCAEFEVKKNFSKQLLKRKQF